MYSLLLKPIGALLLSLRSRHSIIVGFKQYYLLKVTNVITVYYYPGNMSHNRYPKSISNFVAKFIIKIKDDFL